MTYKVGMVSLGCPKNQVDGEMLLARLRQDGFEITADETAADVIIVNTCGFIEDAKREAIDNILEVAQQKQTGRLKALVVTGCLAQRYQDEILKELPEVDAVVGIGANQDICDVVRRALSGAVHQSRYAQAEAMPLNGERLLTTPAYSAYLRIADGCDNCCTYCAIPLIRGRFRSRTMEQIEQEARTLAARGAKELVLIAQDTTRYGEDLYGELRLPELLDRLCEIDGVEWIRILYTYPDRITDRLLKTINRQPKVLPYLDIPLQHASGPVLKRMNRSGDVQSLTAQLAHIRQMVPGITIRTTLIVGFPGETEEDFAVLDEFIKTVRFDRMGCFTYSAEEGTPAASFPDQIEEQVKQRRMEVLMTDQSVISEQLCQQKLGSVQQVLVEGYDGLNKCCYGRSIADAPDIDGKVFFTSAKRPAPGELVQVQITDRIEYDLIGEQLL